jgi:hypothetical protein
MFKVEQFSLIYQPDGLRELTLLVSFNKAIHNYNIKKSLLVAILDFSIYFDVLYILSDPVLLIYGKSLEMFTVIGC